MPTPNFVSIGHITHDIRKRKPEPGGAALYAAYTAKQLGAHAGLITSFQRPYADSSLLNKIDICSQESASTTTFLYNTPSEGHLPMVSDIADPLEPRLVLSSWRTARIVLLCPVVNEFQGIGFVKLFPDALIGLCPQGAMRHHHPEGRHSAPSRRTYREVMPFTTAIFLNEADMRHSAEVVQSYQRANGLVALIHPSREVSLYVENSEYHIPALSIAEANSPGANAVFASAFLINYAETNDPVEAATFAGSAIGLLQKARGIYSVPTREAVQQISEKPSKDTASGKGRKR
jgi:sugar/nucleoside kinase (ribokinase family)